MLTYLCQHFQESQTCSSWKSSQHQACSRSLAYCLTPRLSCLLQASQILSRQILDKKNLLPSTPYWVRK